MSYKPISKLGEGGFGSVWKTKNPENQIVAMKIIKNPDARAKEEVEVLKKLEHVCIIKYLNSYICKNSGDLCIIMKYCEYGSLTNLVQKLDFDTYQIDTKINVAYMIWQIGLALEYVHEKGIIHRDIKPDNILCSERFGKFSFLKLADFGIAKAMDRTHFGRQYARTQIGTPIYMSPEALKGQRYGTPTDIWSLGATISYVCNQGTYLFKTKDAVKNWPGGKSTLDRNKYPIELRQLTADMMNPMENLRPTAEQIKEKAQDFGSRAHGSYYFTIV